MLNNSKQSSQSFLSGRTKRLLRENLLAYAFLSPALILIFSFGIFPLFYAGYTSLFKWRIKQGSYLGLDNYVGAMGDFAYAFFAILALALVALSIRSVWSVKKDVDSLSISWQKPLIYLIPAATLAVGLVLLLLRGVTIFAQDESLILGNATIGFLLILVGGAIAAYIYQSQNIETSSIDYIRTPNFTTPLLTALFTGFGGLFLAYYTYQSLITSPQLPVSLLRLRWIGIGLVILVVAYFVWNWSMRQESTVKLVGGLVGAAGLIGGGAYFIGRWDVLSGGSDPDFYLSLLVTVFYSIGTVPFQLIISLFLANLLYQDIPGKGLFRVIFFIPYIAPTVATAGVFEAIFSIRPNSIANYAFTSGGQFPNQALSWLKESQSIFAVFGEQLGLGNIAEWSFGPSLALFVIIIFNIWVFVGYDTVIFLAGLGNIPGTLYEAAKIDGAGRWHLFRYITLPLLSPTTYFLSVISVIGTFKAFNHIWVLRDTAALGTTDTASVYFFSTFIRATRYGYATSMAMVLFVVILTLQVIQNRIAAKRVFYG